MTIHQDLSEMTGVSELLISLFPNANRQIVLALSDQIDSLVFYLAQVHEVTVGEVREIIDVFEVKTKSVARAVA